jgi:TetR/AcrR family transcriptional regulator, cholesterol catabolism regulator
MAKVERAESGGRAMPPALESLDRAQRERRARIVDAAVRLMLHTDYDQIQMKDIAAAANVALGTTYRYFASKEQLLAEALVTWSDGFPPFDPRLAERTSVDQLKQAFRRAARAFEPHPSVFGTILVLQATTDPLVVPIYDQFAARRMEAFTRYLPDVPSPLRERVVEVMCSVLDGNLRTWSLGRRSIREVYRSLDSAAELLVLH